MPQRRLNPIVRENARRGTTGWRLTGPVTGDVDGQIQGYAAATSVRQNVPLDLHISVSPAQDFQVDVYRMGWYGGAGGRLVHAGGPIPGSPQPPGVIFEEGSSVACSWSVAYTMPVGAHWTSGIYLAKLTNSAGWQSYVMFVVRDDRPAKLLYQQAVLTYQAYNRYPGDGVSFYAPIEVGESWERALSLDRPYGSRLFPRNNQSPFGGPGDGSGGFFTWDYPMVRYLERDGYDVTYATNVDVHLDGARLLKVRGLLSVGHDEYWTDAMAANVAAARDTGVNLAFFSGNMVFGTVGLESAPGPSAPPNRVMRGLSKGGRPGTAGNPDLLKKQLLTGTSYTGCCVRKPTHYWNLPWVVSHADHFLFEGTDFKNGDAVAGLLGYESDAFDSAYARPASLHFAILADSPFETGGNGDSRVEVKFWDLPSVHSLVYQAPSGALVFTAGVTDWPSALDAPFGGNPWAYNASAGDGDPARQGFYADTSAGGAGTLILDQGAPAWRADGQSGRATWSQVPTPVQTQAALQGYTLSAVFRMESGAYIANYYADGARRHLMIVGLNAAGDLVARREDAGGPVVLTSGAAATDYHLHQMVVDASGLGTYWFDGAPVLSGNGAETSQHQITFGNASTDIPGVAIYRSVSLALKQPYLPDARIQALTRNVLARAQTPFNPAAPLRYDASAGDGLPARQGWTASTSAAGNGMLVIDGGQPAWRVDGAAGRANWIMVPSPATKALAATRGFRLATELRVKSGRYVTDYYADGARRCLPILSLVDADLVVDLEGGESHVLATGAAATAWHTSEVVYDPVSDLATYRFDGIPVDTWGGSATSQDFVAFGQGSTAIAGLAFYRQVVFKVLP